MRPPPRYPQLDLPLPLELVNTSFASGGQPLDGLATPDDLDAWLRVNASLIDAATPPRATPALLERFRQLREAVRRMLTAVVEAAPPPADDVRLLNDLAAASPRYPRLYVPDGDAAAPGGYELRAVDRAATPDAAVLASVARATMQLLTRPDLDRLRRCAGPGCVLFFLREHRRRARCSDACGNRARVARHYDQHRRQPSATSPALLIEIQRAGSAPQKSSSSQSL